MSMDVPTWLQELADAAEANGAEATAAASGVKLSRIRKFIREPLSATSGDLPKIRAAVAAK